MESNGKHWIQIEEAPEGGESVLARESERCERNAKRTKRRLKLERSEKR